MKRSAFIGLSGPIFYDYKNPLNHIYPNPILENPFGLMIFFDEIVFLHEALCPKSMKKLEFVKFLTDSQDINDYIEKTNQENINIYFGELDPNLASRTYKSIAQIHKTIAPFATYDNHSRSIGKITPWSTSIQGLFIDNLVVADNKFSLITNSLIHKAFNTNYSSLKKGNLTQSVLETRIPCCLTKKGPYTKNIDEIRKLRYIRQFRNKIDDIITYGNTDNLSEITIGLNNEFNEIRNDYALDRFSKASISLYATIFSSISSTISDFFTGIPLLGPAFQFHQTTKQALRMHEDTTKSGWVAFLLYLEGSSNMRSKRIKKRVN